jgi:hypothetical protein
VPNAVKRHSVNPGVPVKFMSNTRQIIKKLLSATIAAKVGHGPALVSRAKGDSIPIIDYTRSNGHPPVSMVPKRGPVAAAQADGEREIYRPSSDPDRTTWQAFGQDSPKLGNRATPQERNTITASSAPQTTDDEKDQTKPQSQAGTIYLDSGTLGRWTTQHLEHVLSRVPDGMTGIDPRASSPRGRVSPF